ncbi:MAG: ABC transporter substrate-binding protein [Acidimicrobiales bacterium]
MIKESRLARLLAILFALALVAAACGGDDDTDESTEDTTDAGSETTVDGDEPEGTEAEGATGGELILAVEQWPECLNPITSCANASWLSWSVLTHILPRLMELDADNNFVASPTITETPTLDNGGLVTNDDGTFVLTFNLNPDAVWSDGTPITSTDVKFTWHATMNTPGSLSTKGYEKITDIDDSDPQVAVITFEENYAPWPDLFGGTTQYLVPAHGLESYDPADPTTANVAEIWNDSLPISGAPFIQESWGPEQHILVRNDTYWDAERVPLVDRVVMVPRTDTDTEVASLQSGEVMAAFPQPFPGAKDRLTDPIAFAGGGGTFMEGLWINPLAPDATFEVNTAVRQAVAYSLDRQAIADTALGSIIDSPEVLQCAGWNPTFGDWCNPDFERYVQDEAMVEEILTADGWERPDPAGLWQKDGQDLILQWNTTSGNARREDIQAVVTEMTAPFGIGWEIVNYEAGELFQNRLPAMNFGPVALFANSTSPDPSVVTLYDINGIPSEENEFSGQNYTAYENQEASDLSFAIDAEVDPAARQELVFQLSEILAEDVPWIPLYLLPNLLAWRTDMVDGPVDTYAFSAYSGFANIYDWSVTS